jgi:hypothetical protein
MCEDFNRVTVNHFDILCRVDTGFRIELGGGLVYLTLSDLENIFAFLIEGPVFLLLF